MNKPLCIDVFAGLGGWTEGFLAEGYDCVGFDIERHQYGEQKYPAQLVIQDVLTLDGTQFRDATVIVASPPCQEFSRYAMPFGSLWLEHNRMDDDGAPAGNYQGKNTVNPYLFHACFRIAAEAGVPLVVENVKGAQRWVGRAAWHFGNFYLWGDVPALMPLTLHRKVLSKYANHGSWKTEDGLDWRDPANVGIKIGGSGDAYWRKPLEAKRREATAIKNAGVKATPDGKGGYGGDFGWDDTPLRRGNSKSPARKAASALIAKIPLELSTHIARCFRPQGGRV